MARKVKQLSQLDGASIKALSDSINSENSKGNTLEWTCEAGEGWYRVARILRNRFAIWSVNTLNEGIHPSGALFSTFGGPGCTLAQRIDLLSNATHNGGKSAFKSVRLVYIPSTRICYLDVYCYADISHHCYPTTRRVLEAICGSYSDIAVMSIVDKIESLPDEAIVSMIDNLSV